MKIFFLSNEYKSTNPEVDAVESAKTSQLLRVAPPESCKVAMPVVNLGEYLTSSSVSLNSYEKRLCLKSSRVELLGSVQNVKGVGKKSLKKYKADKKMSKTDEAVAVPECGSDMDCSESAQGSAKKIDANHPEKSLAEPSTEPNRFPGRETVERIKNGWNVEEANTITVGDLFLMVRNVLLSLAACHTNGSHVIYNIAHLVKTRKSHEIE